MAFLRTKTQWSLMIIAAIFLLTVPLFASPYWLSWLTRVASVIVAVLGLHVLTGMTGLFSIGHAAFIAVGSYTTAILVGHGVSGWACLPLSALSAGVIGMFFGLPCFRLKGFYLAIATLAAHFIIIWCLTHFTDVTGGFLGLPVPALSLGGIDLGSYGAAYILSLVVMAAATVFVINLERTSVGRCFAAIRDNELAAEVSGISLFRYKMLAFFIACIFAGVAGWMWAHAQLRVNPEQFRLYDSIWYIGMIIVGGMGRTSGVFFGVIFIKSLEVLIDYVAPVVGEWIPSLATQVHVSMSLMLYSGIIVAFLIMQPRGLWAVWHKLKTHYRLHPYSY